MGRKYENRAGYWVEGGVSWSTQGSYSEDVGLVEYVH